MNPEFRDNPLPWTTVAAASPYFTELESARYCRCGVARLRSWDDRGYLTVRTDVDGRRFYVRDELDRVMQGLVDRDGPERPRVAGSQPQTKTGKAGKAGRTTGDASAVDRGSAPAASGSAPAPATKPKTRAVAPGKKRGRPTLPYTDPEQDTRRRGGGGGR